MHNGWSRLGFVLAHAGHVMILSIIACEIIYQISVPSAMPYPATLRVDSAVIGRVSAGQRQAAKLTLTIEADLTPMLAFSNAYMYAYVTAHYRGGERFVSDQVVLYDQVLPNDGKARISVRAEQADYLLRDPASSLLGNDLVLTLSYDVSPYLGLFHRGLHLAHSSVMRLPAAYAKLGGEVRHDVLPESLISP